jgi:hypothetical protein
MRRTSGRIKLLCIIAFGILALTLLLDSDEVVRPVEAFSDGPPPGHTGAPGEVTCTNCHFGPTEGGTFTITPPQEYVPGQTYEITVAHINSDPSRQRWGFQLTALADKSPAGMVASTNKFTQVVGGMMQRDYIEHTSAGSFPGTPGGATWTFNWTAPPTDVGTVTFYAAGNQADNDGTTAGDRIITTSATSQPSAPAAAPFDFDDDGKTDIGIFRPGPAEWWINRSSDSQLFATQFGAPDDAIVPGDYTGDGKADVAIWRPSTGFWFILRSEDFSFFAFPFGAAGDIPVPADFDGDDKTDAAVFRAAQTTWFISRSSGGTDIVQFGAPEDQPVPSDYDGDGKADIAIFRPSLGQWWLNRSTAGLIALTFGTGTDRTVNGDYTGDGKSDVAFWRPGTGEWFVLRSEDFSFYAVPFGAATDVPAPGDYDGDGKWDTAIFRPSETNWYINRSTKGVQIVQFGASGDRPIPNAFVH